MKKTFKYKIPVNYHFIFWVSYFVLNVFRWGRYYEDYKYSFKSNLVTVTFGMILAYFHFYVLLTKFLYKKTILYVVLFLIESVVFLIGIYDIALITTIKLTADWIYSRKKIENLDVIQLKTQIRLHFFFNTLNNLYTLTAERSKYAKHVVLKFSKIMEYILYDAKENRIRLIKEIKYI